MRRSWSAAAEGGICTRTVPIPPGTKLAAGNPEQNWSIFSNCCETLDRERPIFQIPAFIVTTPLMKKFFVSMLLVATMAPFGAQSHQTGGTLAGFLARQGLAGAKLERRFGNHLFIPASINNRRAALLIDTGSPHTVIDVNSVNSFGLTVEKTDSNVGGLFGRSWERYGTSKVKNIALGNCTVTNVPVAIADTSDMNRGRSGPATGSHIADSQNLSHVNGVLGASEMVKFGMIIDCTRQMLYVTPNGPSSAVSQGIAGFLASRGFTRIPMRLNSNHHFDVEGALNGHVTRFIVDTGSGATLIDKQVAVRSGTGMTALTGVGAGGAGGLVEAVSRRLHRRPRQSGRSRSE